MNDKVLEMYALGKEDFGYMDRAAKMALVKTLRSGKYNFGRGELYDNKSDCFCILGVISQEVLGIDARYSSSAYNSLNDHGINTLNIYKLNDRYFESFEQWADYIEEVYELK